MLKGLRNCLNLRFAQKGCFSRTANVTKLRTKMLSRLNGFEIITVDFDQTPVTPLNDKADKACLVVLFSAVRFNSWKEDTLRMTNLKAAFRFI